MAEFRTSHRLTTLWISRSCVFLTTPRARGFAATYNQHIFMSCSQTVLLNGASFVPFFPVSGPGLLLSRPLSSYPFFFLHLLRSGRGVGWGRGRKITRPPWAPSRARTELPSLAICQSGLDPTIVHLHFTIFRSEINATPSVPHLIPSSLSPSIPPSNVFVERGPPTQKLLTKVDVKEMTEDHRIRTTFTTCRYKIGTESMF